MKPSYVLRSMQAKTERERKKLRIYRLYFYIMVIYF